MGSHQEMGYAPIKGCKTEGPLYMYKQLNQHGILCLFYLAV